MTTLIHDRDAGELEWELVGAEPPPPAEPPRSRRVGLLAVLAIVGPLAGLAFGRASASPASIDEPARVAEASVPAAIDIDPLSVAAATTDDALDDLELRLTSQDGRWEAWAEPLPEGATMYAPGGRTSTTIAVRDKLSGKIELMTLPRNLEPEAFSSDGRTLFTIDHRPAAEPEIYRVSALDLRTRTVRDVIGPWKQPLIEEMRGEGRQQVWAPEGGQLFTLYVRQTHVHVDGDHDHPGGAGPHVDVAGTDAFVHVLDVDAGWALCLELPPGFGLGPAGSTDIMVTDGGAMVTVVDHHIGQRVDIAREAQRDGLRADFTVSAPTLVGRPLSDQ